MKIRAIIIEGEVDEATIAAIHAAVAPQAETALVFNPSVAEIVAAVSRELDIPVREITGAHQALKIARARHAVAWIARHVTDRSPAAIGRALGRDRTTTISSLARAKEYREKDAAFRDLTDRLVATYTVGLPS